MFVLLPGGRSVELMGSLAETAGIPVWDLRELEYVRLGDGQQVGEDDVDEDELLF